MRAARWNIPIADVWTKKHGTHANVYNVHRLRLGRDGKLAPPIETVCAWTAVYEGPQFANRTMLDLKDEQIYFEGLDYIAMGLPGYQKLEHNFFNKEEGRISLEEWIESDNFGCIDRIKQMRERRPHFNASWAFNRGKLFAAPKFRPGWGPEYEEVQLLARFTPTQVASWSWNDIERLYISRYTSPSYIFDLLSDPANVLSIDEILGMDDGALKIARRQLREMVRV